MESAVTATASTAPVFIVGPPRSGTSLLSAIIGSHSRIACGPETDLFRALPIKRARSLAQSSNRITKTIEQLDEIRYPDGRSLASHFGLSNEHLRKQLDTRTDFVKAVYAAIPEAFAEVQGKQRWAEKTPRHLFYVDTIRALFPDAKIIRIIRDPRDSIPSVIKNIGLSTSYIAEFYRWMGVYMKSSKFFAQDANSITVRYEDLVTDPAEKVSEICQFIGEEFEPQMLERKGAELVRVASETWKSDIDKKISADNIYGWKSKMDPDVAIAASLICSEALSELGYPDSRLPERELMVYPLGENFGAANEQHILECAKRGLRYRPYDDTYPASISETFKVIPDVVLGDIPLGKKTSVRIFHTLSASLQIIFRFLTARPVSIDPDVDLGVGSLNRCIGKIALIFGKQQRLAP
ncbi:sulfotransferase family protein [Microbulbifer agarilyticus]|uniref:sulfotransferase family protein n=1 Tax=Microbulbifer agarilyticus TaxID=260552 RepID=UPI001CD6BCB5|nr:sulfotransferase [Microbulbifer agarilyticus]MCA0894913.1 sulfotransferase [Microbulbifer agarilyticus]